MKALLNIVRCVRWIFHEWRFLCRLSRFYKEHGRGYNIRGTQTGRWARPLERIAKQPRTRSLYHDDADYR